MWPPSKGRTGRRLKTARTELRKMKLTKAPSITAPRPPATAPA